MDIQKIAKLSRLQFNESEQEKIKGQLEKIITAFDRIKNIPTEKVEPLITPIEIENTLRPDVHGEDINTDKYIELAPESVGRLYKVPRVIS